MKYYYWDMRSIPLNSTKKSEFNDYFTNNRNNFMLIDDNIYIDVVALGRGFNCCDSCCDCNVVLEGVNNCDIFNQPDRVITMNNYCCDGGCIISKDFISKVNSFFDDADFYSYFSNDVINYIETFGFYDSFVVGNKVFFKTNTIKNRCVFSSYNDGKKGCVFHSYCNDKNMNIFETKPFDCSLFPLEILVDDGIYYITAVTDKNSFSRFNENNKPIKLSCLKNSQSTPLYKFCRELIIDIFGEMVYNIIEAYFVENGGNR